MTILVGDCREVLPTLAAGSVDAIVTDPPYGLGFMGMDWDRTGVAFDPATWAAMLPVLKPGGALLAFGGTRTWHRQACAIEDAGFEIKDCLMWLYGSGFPKHKSLLKPAWEPVLLARKRGAATLNVDRCRIVRTGGDVSGWSRGASRASANRSMNGPNYPRPPTSCDKGRWPANVCLDEAAAVLLDAAAGDRGGGFGVRGGGGAVDGTARTFQGDGQAVGYGDSGGPSRFFYCAKASRSEREAGLAGMPERTAQSTGWSGESMPQRQDARPGRTLLARPLPAAANHHPTVKPVALMRWLVRLVTPPGGLVLDPFAGSGSTGVACALEGMRFVGIEQDGDYAEIARRRIAHAAGPLLAEVAD